MRKVERTLAGFEPEYVKLHGQMAQNKRKALVYPKAKAKVKVKVNVSLCFN
jgi:hypothetical protein